MERCFGDKSALLKHEVAYCLGQLGDARAVAKLIDVLADADNQEPIVRHEAGEALGAIGSPDASVMAALRSGCSDAVPEVADTCRLAVARIEYFSSEEGKAEELSANPYNSTDPAPPFPAKETSVAALKGIMLDSGESLFRRYRYGMKERLFCEIPIVPWEKNKFLNSTRILQGAIQPQEPWDGGERAGCGRGPEMRGQRIVQTRGRLRLGADTEQVGSNLWISEV